MASLLVILITILPLAIVPGLSFHYDTVPRIVLLALSSAAILMRPRRLSLELALLWRVPAGRMLALVTCAHVVWFTVVCLASTRPWFSWLGNGWRRMGWGTMVSLVVFAMCSAAFFAVRRGIIVNALRGTAIAASIASLYGIGQYFDLDPLQNPASYHARAGDLVIVRPPGTMGHADYFGWWLAVALFCAIALVRMERGRWRLAGQAAAALCIVAILFTGTRAAMLGAAAGFVCMALAGGVIRWRRVITVGVCTLAIFAVFYYSPPGERLRARVHWTGEEPLGGSRPLLWRDSLRMATAHPLIGTGPETFAAAFPVYQSTDLSRLLPDYYYESAHNAFLDALTEQGIPGALLVCAWIGIGFVAGRKACRAGVESAPALMGAVAASATAGIFGVATAGPVFETLFVIAILVALNDTALSGEGDAAPTAKLAGLWPAAALGLLAVPLAVFGVSLAVSDLALARAAAVPLAEIAAAPRELPARLPGAGEDMFWSRRLSAACASAKSPVARAECMNIARRSAALATDSADDPALAWYNLAIFSSTIGDAAGVENSLRTAIQLSPNWFKPHWSLANLLLLTGRGAEARSEAERGVLLDAGKDAEVNATLKGAQASR
jgi:O-antigen ligase